MWFIQGKRGGEGGQEEKEGGQRKRGGRGGQEEKEGGGGGRRGPQEGTARGVAGVPRVARWHCRDKVHYEYMTLAKKTSVVREAMFLFVETT